MLNFAGIEQKWIKKWESAKIFQPEINKKKPKFFCTFPYPYINAYPHLGHFYTIMRVDAFARYKRMQGYNVLFPQGWHATGSPIIAAARRVKDKEEKQISIMKGMGFSDEHIKKFEKPEYWLSYFAPEFKKDFTAMGLSIDWRREFFTTSLNPHYDRFVRWQFEKLKEKNYIIKGKFPVVWDPADKCPVGDHDRSIGEGETAQESILVRHYLDDNSNRIIVSATLRQDTIYGITNLYVHPNIEYAEVEITFPDKKKEVWIISESSANQLKEQGYDTKIIGKIKGDKLIGKRTKEFGGNKVLILPATFLDENFGTGLVHSVPSDSADDLIALWDLQKDEKTLKKYNLNIDEVRAIKPISVLDTPGYGDVPAEAMLKKYNVRSQNQRELLEKIKEELYKLSFYSSTFNNKYKKGFSKDLHGKKVSEGKEIIKKDLAKHGWIESYYQLTGKVVSRSLHECVVKVVDDQWFIDYNNPEWKKTAHKALDKMKLYPERSRQQFDYVIDWLHEWACTRESGLGTRLPWDEKWLIESLSDSTIYMAYYTIVHLLKKIPADKVEKEVTHELFDYVFLGKGKPKNDIWKKMKKEFDYWYPLDFRNSGKDLIQNHLTFFIFNHCAIFGEKNWPRGIGVNGWVLVDGQKMSKSLGNFILLRDIPPKYGVDPARLTILSGGEGLDDPNWESEFAKSIGSRLSQLHLFCAENYNSGKDDENRLIDRWLESRLNRLIQKTTGLMEETLFRSAIKFGFFELHNSLKWYMRRCNNKVNKKLINKAIETQILMLAPFCPFTAEEIWQALGKKEFISAAAWPKADMKKVDLTLDSDEELIENTLSGISAVLKLAKIEKPKKIKLFVSVPWKYSLFKELAKISSETKNPGEILKQIMRVESLRKYGKEISAFAPKLVQSGKLPQHISSAEKELNALNEAKDFLRREFMGAEIEVFTAENSQELKAKNAMPGKAAILVE